MCGHLVHVTAAYLADRVGEGGNGMEEAGEGCEDEYLIWFFGVRDVVSHNIFD